MVDLSGPALLDLLTPATRAWMAGIGRRREYGDGELVHSRGDSDTTMEVVISGAVRLVRLRQNGSQSFVTTVGPGHHVADIRMLADAPHSHDAVAVGSVLIDHYDRPAFDKLLENREVLTALYRIVSERFSATLSMVDDLRTLSREAHLAKLLLTLTPRSKARCSVDVVQEDLASILGVSAMTVAKSLSVLKSEGLIETGYRKIGVPDRQRLQQWLASQDID